MTIDNIIDITISLGAPPVSRQGFGTPLIVASASSLAAGFTERTRSYFSAADATADTDLAAVIADRVAKIFEQARSPQVVKVGRREAAVAQVNNVLVTGATDGTYTVTINGTDFNFVAAGSTTALIAAGLISAINGGAEPVTATAGAGDSLDITADVAGVAFTIVVSSTADPLTLSETTANVNLSTELAAILADDSDWFHFALDTRVDSDIEAAATFAASNKRMFWAQSSSADIITSATTDVYSGLKSESNRWTAPLYYSDNAVYADVAWMGFFAANDFDSEAPTAAFNTLSGIATEELGATAQGNLDSKNVNYYTTLKGVGATSNAFTPSGFDIELVVTGAWIEARMSESVASLFLKLSNSGSRIRFNDQGFNQIGGLALATLKNGERIGHINPETSEIDLPKRADVSQADIDTGTLRFTFGGQYSGRVKNVIINGIVAADFTSLAA